MPIYIEVKGIGEVSKTLGNYTRTLPKASRRAMWLFTNRLASEIRKEAKLRKHVGSGYLSSPKGTFAKPMGKDTWVVKMPYYTKYLEEGTAPHWIPRIGKTVRWANKHLPGNRVLANGFVITPFQKMRYAIAKRGTRPHPFTAAVIQREIQGNLLKVIDRQL